MPAPPVHVGPAHSVGPFRIRRIDYAPGLRQPAHAHEGASLTLLLAGEIRETTGQREETGSALSVVVKPPDVRHADEVGPRGARTLQVAFGPATVEELREHGAAPERWFWLHGGCGASLLLELAEALHEGSRPASELEDRVIEALGGVRNRSDIRENDDSVWLRRVKEAIEDDPFGELSVRDLAHLVGAHPVSVSRAFRRAFGVTITEHRRRTRLRRAAAHITAGRDSLSGAAHATGYADHPHMCREFQVLAGLSPSALRRLAAG
ncbi:MAG: helix-turn-helix domain-containing protein [Gemmatimonadota bacterium]|nr:helix-turn-helix domain-containing protein [Gemmatimonadota bacterium]